MTQTTEIPTEKFEDNPEAMKAIALIESGCHVFIQGPAGYGKSTLMKAVIESIEAKCAVLAPTGIAAINCEGQTIHSYFGFNIKPFAITDSAQRLDDHPCRSVELIFIDEISMVSASLLHRIDLTLRASRMNNNPFGGVQMVFVGDMAQLPPIEEKGIAEQYGGIYFFNAPVFNEMFFNVEKVVLKKNYRQSEDQEFIEILQNVRNGVITDAQLNRLNQCVGWRGNKMAFCARNKQADFINQCEFDKINLEKFINYATITGFYPTGTRIPDFLEMKVGMKIMFTKNDSLGAYVNGTMGYITDIKFSRAERKNIVTVKKEDGGFVEVKEVDFPHNGWGRNKKGEIFYGELGCKTQMPFTEAWAVSIHKSQGLSFDELYIDMGSGAFTTGQTYVALSRCRTLKGLTLARKLNRSDIKSDPIIVNYLK